MKHFIAICALVLVYSLTYGQDSFSNIKFDGPKRYVPKTEGAVPTADEFRRMKEEIRAFPKRLDFRYVYMDQLANAEDWRRFASEAMALINHSYSTKHRWKWHKQYWPSSEEAEEFVLSTIQDYVLMLYLKGEPIHYQYIRAISETVVKYRPKHVDFLTYPAMTYTDVEDYENAFIHLKSAVVAVPNDPTVNFLMGEHYEHIGDKKNSIHYFRKVVEWGDERSKMQAAERIEKLKIK